MEPDPNTAGEAAAEQPVEGEAQATPETAPETPPSAFDRVAAEMGDLSVKQVRAVADLLDKNPNLSPQQCLILAKSASADLFPPERKSATNVNPNRLEGSPAPSHSAPAPRPAPKSPAVQAQEKMEAARADLLAVKGGNSARAQAASAFLFARRQAGLIPAAPKA